MGRNDGGCVVNGRTSCDFLLMCENWKSLSGKNGFFFGGIQFFVLEFGKNTAFQWNNNFLCRDESKKIAKIPVYFPSERQIYSRRKSKMVPTSFPINTGSTCIFARPLFRASKRKRHKEIVLSKHNHLNCVENQDGWIGRTESKGTELRQPNENTHTHKNARHTSSRNDRVAFFRTYTHHIYGHHTRINSNFTFSQTFISMKSTPSA